MLGGPESILGVRSTRSILRAVISSIEKQFISITNGSDILGINRPIYVCDGGIVLGAFTFETVAIINIIDVNICVVRAHS
jgi:hypothetical protein